MTVKSLLTSQCNVNADAISRRCHQYVLATDKQTNERTNEQTNGRTLPLRKDPATCTLCGRGLSK